MQSSPNLNKYANFLEQITPPKINVMYDINSWLETNNKNQVVYKYRHHRKYLKQEKKILPPQYTNKKADLAQLKAYKQNLLKSSIKKISERSIPLTKKQPSTNESQKQVYPKIKGINFQVKSLGRAYQRPKYQPIIITEFQPNVQERQEKKQKQGKLNLYLQIQFQQQNRAKKINQKVISGNKTVSVSLYRPRKMSTRRSSRINQSKSQASIALPCKITNPQENGVSLVSRRLLSKNL